MFNTETKTEKAILVGLQTEDKSNYDVEESLQELSLLTETSNVEVLGVEKQARPYPHSAYYIGSGKAKSLAQLAKNKQANVIIFDDNLTPSQDRNLSKITNLKIIDRTQLILDIFAQHAKTRQSKLQVELAQLQYNLSRLKGKWPHLSRIEGGIGFRGPGERQLEVDRRRINDRISLLKSKLKFVEKTTEIKRKKRRNLFSVGIVGYTNAGKTTILNKLTSSNIYTANKLFVTLDTTTKGKKLSSNDKIVISDTIGFIRKLPPYLISSFHATLQEVINADLLLHVIDISHPKLYEYMETVFTTLKIIGAEDNNMLLVLNKIDLLPKYQFLFMKKKLKMDFPNSVFVSAKSGENFEDIEKGIIKVLSKGKRKINLKIPNSEQKLISFLHNNTEILHKRYNNNFTRFHIRLPYTLYSQKFDLLRKYEIKTKRMAKRQELNPYK
ncbi:MAG: GTPase HflX [Candidatus Cloacimonetes bacterium]|nr:GTPase HflX [Candidatus Cloacimonadota bacterium]